MEEEKNTVNFNETNPEKPTHKKTHLQAKALTQFPKTVWLGLQSEYQNVIEEACTIVIEGYNLETS